MPRPADSHASRERRTAPALRISLLAGTAGLLALLGGCHIDFGDHDGRLTIDGYEMRYRRTVGMVLDDLADADLRCSIGFGDIEVTQVDGESRVVAGLREAEPRDGLLEFEDGELRLLGRDDRPIAADWLRIEVGSALRSLTLATGNGSIEIRAIEVAGELDLHTNLGDIELEDLPHLPRIRAESGLGDIELARCSADELDLQTDLGDVELDRIASQHALVRTGLGDVEIDGSDIELLDARTSLGDVEGSNNTIRALEAGTSLGGVDLK